MPDWMWYVVAGGGIALIAGTAVAVITYLKILADFFDRNDL